MRYAAQPCNSLQVMNDLAPIVSTRERVKLVLKILAVAAPVYLLAQFWLFPWLQNYASFANCYFYGDINGVHLLMYGVFVFIPLSLALLIWLFEGKRCLRIFRIGQNPLPGEKVLRKTRYRYGRAAMIQPFVILLALAVLIGASVWGGFQAEKITRTIKPCSDQQLQQIEQQPD